MTKNEHIEQTLRKERPKLLNFIRKRVPDRDEAEDILQDVDLTIPKGSVCALIGPSGSGKTTLLRCLLGQVPLKPGQVEVLGQDMAHHARLARAGLGWMPERGGIIPGMSGVGLVAYLGEHVGWTATNALRADLYQHCLKLDMSFHNQHAPGELIERIAPAESIGRTPLDVTANHLPGEPVPASEATAGAFEPIEPGDDPAEAVVHVGFDAAGQIAGGGQGKAGHAPFRGRIGRLAHLALEGRARGNIDHHAGEPQFTVVLPPGAHHSDLGRHADPG